MSVDGQTCSPARCEREIAFVLVFPESLPALPPAWETHTLMSLKLINSNCKYNAVHHCWQILPPILALCGYSVAGRSSQRQVSKHANLLQQLTLAFSYSLKLKKRTNKTRSCTIVLICHRDDIKYLPYLNATNNFRRYNVNSGFLVTGYRVFKLQPAPSIVLSI